ncbi:MAG: flagellar hook-length control protein FliK [Gammaproteobacteria bacterium]
MHALSDNLIGPGHNLGHQEPSPASKGNTAAGQSAMDAGSPSPQFAQTLENLLGDKKSGLLQTNDDGGPVQGSEPESDHGLQDGQSESGEFQLPRLNQPVQALAEAAASAQRSGHSPAAVVSPPGELMPEGTGSAQLSKTGSDDKAVKTANSGNTLPPSGSLLPGSIKLNIESDPIKQSTPVLPAEEAQLIASNATRGELTLDSLLRGKFRQDRFSELRSSQLSGETTESGQRRTEMTLPDRSFQLQFLQATGSTAKVEVDSAQLFTAGAQNSQAAQPGAALAPRVDSGFDMQLALEGSRSSATRAPEAVVRDHLATQLGNVRWHADFAGKLRVLSQANISAVELNLNPAELGAIDIRIQSLDEGTIINFFTANANTREVIDASLPRLRELLSDSGIELQHGDVSDREPGADTQEHSPGQRLAAELSEELGTDMSLMLRSRQQQRSMIDHYV